MLAVKFHHLRALIHRPFLCLPFLQTNMPFIDLLLQHKERISEAEYICIHEAQQTAHLLHNVTDERSLVHDFPWWQMISCLICASSILFVAETFYSDNILLHDRTSAQELREDAESCLKVFEALSVNSIAAQKAADMLVSLSRVRRQAEDRRFPLSTFNPRFHTLATPFILRLLKFKFAAPFQSTVSSRPITPLPPLAGGAYPPQPGTTPDNSASDTLPSLLLSDIPFPSDWPSEISNAMEWSVQFLDHPNLQQFGPSLGSDSAHR